MKIELDGPVDRGLPAHPEDVRQIKRALGRHGLGPEYD